MKRIISVVLSVLMLCGLFAGCGSNNHRQNSSQEENQTSPEATPAVGQPIEWKDETVKKMVCDLSPLAQLEL